MTQPKIYHRIFNFWCLVSCIFRDSALVEMEENSNLALVGAVFKMIKPNWSKIRVVMTAKALNEKEVLHEGWPNARQLLCRWHMETLLKRKCSPLGGVGKTGTKPLKVIKRGLVNAESQQQYDDFKMLCWLQYKETHLYKSFTKRWDTTTDMWVIFKRGGVPHLKNNTNDHLEAKWGRMEIVDGNFTIDVLVFILITLPNYAEDRNLPELHHVGSRPPMA